MLSVKFNRDGSIKSLRMNATERGQMASAAGLLLAIGRLGCEESGCCLDAVATIDKVIKRYGSQETAAEKPEAPAPPLDNVPSEFDTKAKADKDAEGMYAGQAGGAA